MKKNILIGVLAVALAAAVWVLSRQVTMRATNSFEECVAHGFPVMESYPRQCRAGDRVFVEKIPPVSATSTSPVSTITPPAQERSPSATISASGRIRVYMPNPGDVIGLPLEISGDGQLFEGAWNYRIRDARGVVILERHATAGEADLDGFRSFRELVNYPALRTSAGTVEVFTYSARDGSEQDLVKIPVTFGAVESMLVKAFFQEPTEMPPDRCDKVEPTFRRIPRIMTPLAAAINELLLGPDGVEARTGLITSINTGVKLQRAVIEDGVAKLDFNDMLQAGVGGSCRVTAIRAQINATALQFASVRDVVISINGVVEGSLEP